MFAPIARLFSQQAENPHIMKDFQRFVDKVVIITGEWT